MGAYKPPRTYEEAVLEGQAIGDEPHWKRLADLAEYVAHVFLKDLPFGTAVQKYIADVGYPISLGQALRWIYSARVWHKTQKVVRDRHKSLIYYSEAAESEDYRQNKLTATQAVMKAKNRRRERSIRNASAGGITTLANAIESGEAKVGWIDPERAQDLLDRIPIIVQFLRKCVRGRKGKVA